MAKKFYVVWSGYKTGIFHTWAECEKQTKGYAGARFKSFPTLEEAQVAIKGGGTSSTSLKTKKTNNKNETQTLATFEEDSISVDAACSGNPGMMEYRGVATKDGETLFHFGPILGTNNIGEFLGLVHALSFLKKQNSSTTIYTDSMTALAWVRNKKANTTLVKNKETEEVWNMILRAENWLKANTYPNKLLKWETKIHGEIKADFGRK